MKTIRAILIDPKAQTVEAVDMPAGDYKAFYPLLQCDTFDVARSEGFEWMSPLVFSTASEDDQNAAIDIYCDDEGLFAERPLYATRLPSGNVLAGRLVICSSDDEGNTTAAPKWLTPQLVRSMVDFGTLGE